MSNTNTFEIGQIVDQNEREYASAAVWCTEGNGVLTDLGNGTSRIDAVPVQSFEDLQKAKHEEVNTIRDGKEQDYFIYDGSKFDSDAQAAQRLAIASQTAATALTAGQPFEITWTLYDNANRIMTAQNMIEVIPAFAMWSSAVHNYASTLKTQVDSAATTEQLDAIDIETGWPTPEQVAGI